MTVGLFGAYTGSPRIQRAYATGCSLATNEAQLRTALTDSSETCIEIQGTITLTQDLPRISHSEWNGSSRESLGLTIFGSGDDTIDGDDTYSGIRLVLDDPNQQIASDVQLNINNLSLTNFDTPNNPLENSIGNATYAYLYQQPHDLRVTLQGVHLSDNVSLLQGGALYTATNSVGNVTTSVYTTIIDSTFTGNSGGVHGGAVMVSTEDDTAILDVRGSTFESNQVVADGLFSSYSYGGAIATRARNQPGVAQVIVGPGSHFHQNSATALTRSVGGALFTSGLLEITGSENNPVTFRSNSADKGGALYARGGGSITSTILEGNTADYGGAVFSTGNEWVVTDTTITGNLALRWGGGFYSSDDSLAFYRSAVVYNESVVGSPGGILAWGGPLTIENSFIGFNSAITDPNSPYTDAGGGIWTDGDVHLRFSTVYDNVNPVAATEIGANNITSVMSIVGNSQTGNIWSFAGTLDDSFSVSTSDDTQFGGLGSGNEPHGSLDFAGLNGTAPGELGRTPGVASVLATPVSSGGFAPTTNPLSGVTHDQLGVRRATPFTIGARQGATAPNPPTPTPAQQASAPREVRADAGIASATVSWIPPDTVGSFPITTYQAVASPGGQSCLVTAPALTCTITGLAPDTSYTVTARALTGAGWSAASSPSAQFTPLSPEVQTILITSSRDKTRKSIARVEGMTTGLVGAQVVPYIKVAGKKSFSPGTSTRTVDADGTFMWQRKTKKRFTVYFVSGTITSNRLVIPGALQRFPLRTAPETPTTA